MQRATVTYTASGGWNAPLPAALDGAQTWVLAFAAPGYANRPAPFEQLAAAFPRSHLMGCSGAGQIAGMQCNDDSVTVAVVRFEHTRLRRAFTAMAGATDSFAAGARIAAELADPALRAVVVLSVGQRVNGARLVEGLTGHLAPGVLIAGGLAGDASPQPRTWILDGARPATGCVSAIGLYGPRLRVSHGCASGWSGFGPERQITRCDGNVLYELDGKPALALYKTYLGERAAELPGSALLFPLAVQRSSSFCGASSGISDCGGGSTVNGCSPLVRAVLSVDEAQQSLTFAGDLPQGGVARLMRAGSDKMIASAGSAAQLAAPRLDGAAAGLVLTISCVGRRLVLGDRTDEELEAVVANTAPAADHIGFFSFGEIGPPQPGNDSELHNQTLTFTAFGEA